MVNLDNMRDELADKFESNVERVTYLSARGCYLTGFDAAVSILQPKLDLAVEEIKACIAEKYEYKWGSIKEWEKEIDVETNLALAKIKGVNK